ncbi:MAG: hypothetical protein R3C44_21725 [Chloroflexota bacterium]
MEKRKRITNILIAGTLTVLLLAVFLAFRGGNETAALEAETATDTAMVEMVGDYEADIATLQAQVEALQTQNAAYAEQNEELRTAVTTLQEREGEYQAQIEAANQTINQLSTQSGSLALEDQGFADRQPRGRTR